ncbi:hypothetical protein Q3G72_029564 [Acer saccharum]|nr:hypothetical protein Q3G72_029564 [Acer saccharum]
MEVSLIEAMNLPFAHLDAFTFPTKIRLQLLRRTPRLGRHKDDDDDDVRLCASSPLTMFVAVSFVSIDGRMKAIVKSG